jgi:hypothetical protein
MVALKAKSRSAKVAACMTMSLSALGMQSQSLIAICGLEFSASISLSHFYSLLSAIAG